MNPLSLFYNNGERGIFILLAFLVFSGNIFYYYQNFQDLKQRDVHFTEAKVLKQYQKEKKRGKYWVLKLQTKEYSFYTTSREDLKDLTNQNIKVGFLTKKIVFYDYLKGFYATSIYLSLDKQEFSPRKEISSFIKNQHEDKRVGDFYSSIFTGTPVSKDLREDVTNLGIAHLIAISGFHIGIIAGLIALILSPIYSFFQNRYFPYRNRYLDLYLITGVILLGYISITGFIPSLIRSFGMFLFGGFLVFRNIKILNYENLFIVGVGLIALFPKLLLSLGFFFSMAGVFYIYLAINNIDIKNKWIMSAILGVLLFIYMLPLSFYFFDKVSYYQILSPLLTLGFPLFY
ncbi:MAG: ComEC/Rec2 family competence protein, partial [Campylobacterales bacterium]|nr:ComEC/Rec2 family competence protein [Campylobacterales bacterium]